MAFKHILVAIDLNDTPQAVKVLEVADRLAVNDGADLDVLFVIPSFGMSMVGTFFPKDFEKKALEGARQKLEEFLSAQEFKTEKVEGHISHGTVYEEIIRSANKHDTDLIVIGAHRPELRDFLLGPNAARVVRHAGQSVFIVRD